MPKKQRAHRAPVISLATVRAVRAERYALPTEPAEEKCDPYDVMEAMIDGYFRAMSSQLDILKAERQKA